MNLEETHIQNILISTAAFFLTYFSTQQIANIIKADVEQPLHTAAAVFSRISASLAYGTVKKSRSADERLISALRKHSELYRGEDNSYAEEYLPGIRRKVEEISGTQASRILGRINENLDPQEDADLAYLITVAESVYTATGNREIMSTGATFGLQGLEPRFFMESAERPPLDPSFLKPDNSR